MRKSGILMPVSSLPSAHGIGCISKEAYEFVDFLKASGQSLWQVLPLGPTGYGDSPYQSLSTFAGNPYFICLDTLAEEGLLTRDEIGRTFFGSSEERVDYGAIYQGRYLMLRIAYGRFLDKGGDEEPDYKEFLQKEAFWLDNYALFMALKGHYAGRSWMEWDAPLREREPAALEEARAELSEEVGFWCFQQYEFQKQWTKLHKYANKQGVEIIGDIPFYAAMDSADAWSHPEAFQFDRQMRPIAVAGCAPDAFSATGQLWGNPLYDWKAMKKDGYGWWIRRIARSREMYDVIRIDHFNGFDSYYAVPYGDRTAENGTQEKGPGMAFFRELRAQLGDVKLIAEDLGTLTPSSERLLKSSGCPGMKVLQYAFDWTESSLYLSYNHIRNCVVYTGTHDNNTTRAWIEEISDHDRDFARRFIGSENTDYGKFTWDFIREAQRSVADTCIIPLQDYLVKGSEARINCPGTQGNNWQWRLKPHFLSRELADSIRRMTQLYGRLPEQNRAKEK